MTAAPEVTATDVGTLTTDNVSARPSAQCASRSRDVRRTGSEPRRLGRSET